MFEATSWVTCASRDDDSTFDASRMNAERLFLTKVGHGAAEDASAALPGAVKPLCPMPPNCGRSHAVVMSTLRLDGDRLCKVIPDRVTYSYEQYWSRSV
jgi:hypothetical protein